MKVTVDALIRLLVPAYWLFGSLDVASSIWFADALPQGLRQWQQAQADSPAGLAGQLEIAWMLVLLVALIAGSLGIWKFRNWGRWLFAWANLAMFLSYPMLDALVYTWFGGLFADLAFVATGGLLVVCFLAPGAERFTGASAGQA